MTENQKNPHPQPNKNNWIHCNTCYETYIKKDRSFYLLACHHILCASCLKARVEYSPKRSQVVKCPLCVKQAKFCEINNTMPKGLKELFHPEPWRDGVNNFQIMEFQGKHRKRFLEFLDSRDEKIKDLCRGVSSAKDNAQRTSQLFEDAKAERKYLEKRVRLIKEHRRSLDDNRLGNSFSSSSSERSMEKKVSSADGKTQGITSFTAFTPDHSFDL
ncbi:RING finger protein vilya-like [Haematobia irritans]|uniref:RING finger protein vilya-like n=1 Tax=Haematobia irritans TaxID=7368 RepID=UPI003F4FDFFC